MISISFIGIIVAAIASFVLGFLFHGPISGKLWMKLANIHPTGKEKMSDMYGQMFWNLIVNIITATVMSIIFSLIFSSSIIGPATICKGALMGILFWFGFLVTSSAIEVIWMGRNYKLWIFESICSMISMAVMGTIIVIL